MPIGPHQGLANEIRNRPSLLAGEVLQTAVNPLVEIELSPHHVMYIHRGSSAVKAPPESEAVYLFTRTGRMTV